MVERKYWVFCDDGCKFESMTKEQILAAIQQAIETGEIGDIDAGFITKIKEQNAGGTLSFWKGTEEQLNKISPNISGYAVARLGEDGTVYLCEGDTYLKDWKDICVMAAEDRAAALLSKKQDLHKATVAAIHTVDWDESTKIATVSSVASGQPAMSEVVTATNTVFVFPMANGAYYWTSHPWNLCGIRCIEQGNGYLRFMCDKIPEEMVWFNVVAFPEVGSEGESGGSPVSGYLRTSGGDMQGLLNFLSGGINMGGFPLYGLADPANDNEAARKKYVDDNCLSKTEGEELDSSASYSKEVPEKSAGYAKVNEIGGVTRKTKNLFDPTPIGTKTFIGLTYTTENGYVKINGTKVNGANIHPMTEPNMTLPAGTYTISVRMISGTVSGIEGSGGVFFGINKNSYGQRTTPGVTKVGDVGVRTFTLSEPTLVSSFDIAPDYASVGAVFDNAVFACQFEKSDTATEYEPYFDGLRSAPVTEVESEGADETVIGTLPIPEAVRPKHGINEEVYDYIDLDAKQSAERVGAVVFDGSADEQWMATPSYNTADYNAFYIRQYAKNAHKTSAGVALCDKLSCMTAVELFEKNVGGFYMGDVSDKQIIFRVPNNITTAAEMRTWLAENPLTIYYELATPEITDISDLLPADNIIGVEGGGTVTMRNEYGYDVPSKVMFCKNTAASHVGAKDFVGDLIGTAKRAESDPDGNSIPGTYSKKDETPKVGTAEYWSGEESMFGTAFYDPANKKGYFYCGGRIGLATLAHGVTIPLFAGLTVTEVRVSAEGETFRESVGTAFDSDGAITIGAGVDSPATVYAVNGEFTFA